MEEKSNSPRMRAKIAALGRFHASGGKLYIKQNLNA